MTRVLFLIFAPPFQKFHLTLDTYGGFNLIDPWISTAIEHNVQDVELNYFKLYDVVFKHPQWLFTSKTLVVLKLVGGFLSVPGLVLLLPGLV